MKMKTKSCKAKGRRLQNDIAAQMLHILQGFDPTLNERDCHGAIMGTSGADIVLSSRARSFLDWDVECKNVEALNVTSTFLKHFGKYAHSPSLKLLVHKRNRTNTLVTLQWSDFMQIYALTLLTVIKFATTPEPNATQTLP